MVCMANLNITEEIIIDLVCWMQFKFSEYSGNRPEMATEKEKWTFLYGNYVHAML